MHSECRLFDCDSHIIGDAVCRRISASDSWIPSWNHALARSIFGEISQGTCLAYVQLIRDAQALDVVQIRSVWLLLVSSILNIYKSPFACNTYSIIRL